LNSKIYFIFILLLTSNWIQAQNLLLNTGFENGITNWSKINATGATVSSVNNVKYSGNSSLNITINNTNTVSAGVVQSVAVQPLKKYLLEYYIKTDNLIGNVFPYFNFTNGNQVNYETGLIAVNGTTNWKKFQSRFTVPAGNTTGLSVFVFFTGTGGNAYLDSFSLTEVKDTTWSNFNVDISRNVGNITNYMGTNVGPKRSGSVDLTNNFKQTGINYVRTHDYYGACDISTIFPDMSKNAFDPNAYNFSSTDIAITSSINAGCKILFRLGQSYEANPTHNTPPTDMNKWAEVCLNIVKHYNAGWKNGFNYNIKEWEIWNEPDLNEQWNGTPSQYVKLYRITSQKLKNYDNTLIVGGPAIASLFNTNFLNTFLDSVKTSNLPLDFFSYHIYYTSNPYHFKYADSLAKSMLTTRNLLQTKRYVTEVNTLQYDGNSNHLNVWHNNLYIASQAASVLNYWQNNGPDKIFWYRTDEYLFGLYDESNGKYNYSGTTFRAINQLNTTPLKLLTSGADSLGKTISAGKSITGDSINILISDHASMAKGYRINLNKLLTCDNYSYTVYRVADSLTLIKSGKTDLLNNVISVNAQPPFTDLIQLTKIATISSIVPVAGFTYTLNPNSFSLTNTSTHYDSSRWDINNSSTFLNKDKLTIYYATPTYTVCLIAKNKCFSDTICSNLKVRFLKFDTLKICSGDSILINNNWRKKAGNYIDTLQSYQHIDSIVTTTLLIKPSFITTKNITINKGDSILINGAFKYTSGIYNDTLQTKNGCDSIVSIILSINPAFTSYSSISICKGDSILINGVYQHLAGTYTDTLQSVEGKDSISIIELLTWLTNSSISTVTICEGDSILINGKYRTKTDRFNTILKSIHGCDSIVTVSLIINKTPTVNIDAFFPDTVLYNSKTIALPLGTPSGGIYSGKGVNSNNFVPSISGVGSHYLSYTYIDTNNCSNSDSTAITVLLNSSIIETTNWDEIYIYPNPNTGKFTIAKRNKISHPCYIQLYDTNSKIIFKKNMLCLDNEIDIDITEYCNGIYYLELKIESKIYLTKIIKN
jgi:hypothetical protein